MKKQFGFANMLRKKLKLNPLNTNETFSSTNCESETTSNIAEKILQLEVNLNNALKSLKFNQPVAYVYYPLDYAYKPHSVFVHKYCKTTKKVLFVGMNPGPWGMCQTGIPFGEINIVKDWFKINDEVIKPDKECPTREILGMDCTRSEISGQRIWGLFRNICGTPEKFFESAFMYNYCPIAMLKSTGNNITPTEIKGPVQKQLEELCDQTLYDVIKLLKVETVVGVGKFVEKRTNEVVKRNNSNTKVLYLLHPSPRVANNQNWVTVAAKKLDEFKLMPYFQN